MTIGSSVALAIAALHFTDTQFFAASSSIARMKLLESSAPSWYGLTETVGNIWIGSEFIVMLTNKKRQAIHDFIAGTVVIEDNRAVVSEGSDASKTSSYP